MDNVEYDRVHILRRKVEGQILDWATALEMNASDNNDPSLTVAKNMREFLRAL